MKGRILSALTVLTVLLTGAAASAVGAGTNQGSDFIFVCPILENEYWEECIRGIHRADAELGTTTQVIGPQKADNFAQEIVGYMEQAVAARPDGIMAYGGIEGLFPLINEASGAGIPVLTVDSDAPNTERVAYLGTNLYEFGYRSGETMVEFTGGEAKIGYICSSFSAQSEAQVYQAFQDAIHDYSMEVVAEGEGQADPETAARTAEAMLREHPEITAIFCTGGYNATGAARVKQAMKRNDVVLVGFDDVPENLDFVRQGVINALLAQSPEEMGYQSVYLMRAYLDKGSLPLKSYNTGTMLITRENVDSYASAELASQGAGKTVRVGYYTGDSAFQDGFEDGVRKSGYAYEYYMTIATLTGWRYEYVYGSRTEIMERLRAGEVDIVAGVYQTEYMADQVLFSSRDMGMDGQARYFALTPTRNDLLVDLDRAMELIWKDTPSFAFDLRQKYYNQTGTQQILTEHEKEWLARAGVISVGYVRHNLPLSDQGKDGEPTGLVQTLIEFLSEYLHVEIAPIGYESIPALEEALRKGEVNAAFPIYSDVWLNESKGFLQTDAFVNERVMLVYNGSYSNDVMNSVGLSDTGIGQRYYLAEHYPQAHIQYYETREDNFRAIEKGEVRCSVGCSSVFQRFLATHPEHQDLNVAYLDASEDFGMAVNQGGSILVGILNKAIRSIDNAAITDAIVYYSNVGTEPTLQDFLREYAPVIIMILDVIFAVLVWVFIAYRRKVRAFNTQQIKTQAQLKQALKEAEKASEAKTLFLSSMSHDIRTPMNAIVGMTTIASKRIDDKARVEDCLRKIELSSRHLLTLINDVLDISKIESGKVSLNPVNFSLREAMDSLINIVRPEARAKGLRLEVHIPKFINEIVYADEVRFNQIAMNILSNAVKYTPEGGSVRVELLQEPLPGGERVGLIYRVADSGIGMSEEFMKSMYDIFARAQDGRINKIQGTGLGLSIVKSMVELMGGTIACESQEGVGTTFTITMELPIGEENEEDPGTYDETGRDFNGMRLLVAEDNELNWEVIHELLDMHEIVADHAENGQVCVDILSRVPEGTYDLVLMDVQMPVMNGKEAAAAIRASSLPHVRKVPIIAMTADAFAEDIAACLAAGMDDHVSKPVDMDKLFQVMRKVLSK